MDIVVVCVVFISSEITTFMRLVAVPVESWIIWCRSSESVIREVSKPEFISHLQSQPLTEKTPTAN